MIRGVLSNGRSWRLLHHKSSRTLETYFEIDLLAALTHPDETMATAVIAYFWLFFNDTTPAEIAIIENTQP